jgi:hypothetical protein
MFLPHSTGRSTIRVSAQVQERPAAPPKKDRTKEGAGHVYRHLFFPPADLLFCLLRIRLLRRRLPIVDNGLPWAISRSQITHQPDLTELAQS